MKTIKTFRYNGIFAYDRSGERLAGRVQDLLKDDHVIHTFYTSSTGSTRGDGQTAIFFDKDTLNLPDQIGYFGYAGGPDLPMEFILVPIEYKGQQYDAWITVPKLNNCFNSTQLEELKQVLPKYFSVQKLGFFSEDMNMKFDLVQEGITTNFNSQEIIHIMEDENLDSESKCRRLFNRGEDYLSHVQGLCFRKTDRGIQYLVDHNFVTPDFKSSGEENRNAAGNHLDEIVDIAEELNNSSGKRTLFLDNRRQVEEPCTLEQSWDFYVVRGEANGGTKERKAENGFTHIKDSVSYIEDQGITQEKPKKRLGFFNEDMDLLQEGIEKNLTPQEIGDIMTDESLSGDQKSQRLFGRPEDYISHLQYFCMEGKDEITDYLREHNYLTKQALQLNNLTDRLHDIGDTGRRTSDRSIRGNISVCTVFYTSHDEFTLDGSWKEYVGSAREGYYWGSYIKFCINLFEESGLVQHVPQKKLGFFSESKKLTEEISNDWCQQNLKIDYNTLFDFAEKNFCDDWNEPIEPFCISGTHPDNERARTGIVSPWYNDGGNGPFHSLQEMCDFYGEDFVKDWLTKFVEWLEENDLWEKPKPKLGFFDK